MKLIYMAGATLVVGLWSLVVMVCYWIVMALEGTVESLGGVIGLGWLADFVGDATQVVLVLVWLGVSVAIYVAAWLVAAGKSALLQKLFGRRATAIGAKVIPRMPERFRR
jgi:hypothetical protein